MSRQNSIMSYFKSTLNYNKKRKDRKISNDKQSNSNLIHSASAKSPKMSPPVECDVIILSSDHSEDSDTPIIIIPEETGDENISPSDSMNLITVHNLNRSPQKSPRSGGKKKFYSPTKKRLCNSRHASSVQRSLDFNLDSDNTVADSNSDISHIFEFADDKTIFLRHIIYECTAKDNLKNLLPDEYQTLLLKCLLIEESALRLVGRLYWHLEGWYMKKKMTDLISNKGKVSVSSADVILNSLLIDGFLVSDTQDDTMNFDDLTRILSVNDIKFVCRHFKLKSASKKNGIEALKNFVRSRSSICPYFGGNTSDNSSRVLKLMKQKAGPCYKLSNLARDTFHQLYILMYLGIDYGYIRDKRLEFMLINEKIKKETFPVSDDMNIDDASAVFESRHEFQRYVAAHTIYEDYLKTTELDKRYNSLKMVYELYKGIEETEMNSYKGMPVWLHRFSPPYIYLKLLDYGIQDLKKGKTADNISLALSILTGLIEQSAFRQHKKAEWYSEKAHILHKDLCLHDDAAEVLIEGFISDIPEEDKDILRPRAKIIANHKSIVLSEELRNSLLEFATKDDILEKNISSYHIYKLPMDSNSKGKSKFETRKDGVRIVQSAEEFCKTHYIELGEFTHGEHWEGRFVLTIFFLLFWDIIYGKVRGARGVFLSRYQRAPLDIISDSFYHNRKVLIEDRLKLIEQSSVEALIEMMFNVWHSRPDGEISGLVRDLGWESVRQAALCCAGGRGLGALCRRLVYAPFRSRAGFPDLTLWNALTKKIKFVEVKTDSDRPSMRQLQWLRYLKECGFEAELCYVGAHTTRCKARAK